MLTNALSKKNDGGKFMMFTQIKRIIERFADKHKYISFYVAMIVIPIFMILIVFIGTVMLTYPIYLMSNIVR